MSQVKLSNKPSRNGFDLSKRNIFSAKVGELLPVYCKEIVPGDEFKMNTLSFTRTMPLNTASFTRIKEYYDWFFVPTNLLWNKFNSFVTQMIRNNQHASSPVGVVNIGTKHPYFTLDTVFDYVTTLNNAAVENENPFALNFFGYNRGLLSCKLLDYLGYSDMSRLFYDGKTVYNGSGQYGTNPALNPFPLLAYQKIYADNYRNSQWEDANAPSFNVDYLAGESVEIDVEDIKDFTLDTGTSTMFDLRYANWHKDLFTGVLPNSQYGDAASVDLSSILDPKPTNLQLHNGAPNSTVSTNSNGLLSTPTGSLPTIWNVSQQDIQKIGNSIGLTPSKLRSAFSILALRQAEALQKWKEITQSRQQDYKSQLEAHFGVTTSDAYAERSKWLGGFDNVIDVNEVVNTNLVNGDLRQSADIAGKGTGRQDSKARWSFNEHGILMCIYHAEPVLDYSLETRIPRQNLKTFVSDYLIPELDKTGMVQVPLIEMTNDIELNDGVTNQLLGYAPRYYDYKTDVDEVHGSLRFRDSAWVAPYNDQYLKEWFYRGQIGVGINPIDYSFFKVNPAILDPIFVAQIQQGDVSDVSVNTDQLMINAYFGMSAVRNIDRNGLPY